MNKRTCAGAAVLALVATGCLSRIEDGICQIFTAGLAPDCDSLRPPAVEDTGPPRVEAVPGSGTVRPLSDEDHGAGLNFRWPHGIAVDEAGGRSFVVDHIRRAVVAVDLATGSRTDLSSDGVGAGPLFQSPLGLAFDRVRQRAYVVDHGIAWGQTSGVSNNAILAVDLADGMRTVLSSATVGGGALHSNGAIAWDSVGDRLLLVARDAAALVAVDPETGVRLIVSDGTHGNGPELVQPAGVAVDAASGVAYVSDVDADALYAVDLATGNRAIVSGPGLGTGPALPNVQILALGSGGDEVFAMDWDTMRIVSIDVRTGNRAVAAGPLDGRLVWAMTRWEAGNRLLLSRY